MTKDLKSLRSIIELIVSSFKNQKLDLNFGALSLRNNQSTFIEGCMNKFFEKIGKISYTPFELALAKTIDYYYVQFNSKIK